jgi:hypothetical protein
MAKQAMTNLLAFFPKIFSYTLIYRTKVSQAALLFKTQFSEETEETHKIYRKDNFY